MKRDCHLCPSPQLCCSQYIFIRNVEYKKLVRLARYASRTLNVVKVKGGYIMNPDHQVCVFLEAGVCSIYKSRPKQCKEFYCKEGMIEWTRLEKMVRDGVTPLGLPVHKKSDRKTEEMLRKIRQDGGA